jgi:hypothetical protein
MIRNAGHGLIAREGDTLDASRLPIALLEAIFSQKFVSLEHWARIKKIAESS